MGDITRPPLRASYALVLALLAITFVTIMVAGDTRWGRVASVVLQGLTLVAVFEVARARRLLIILAITALVLGTGISLALLRSPEVRFEGGVVTMIAALLLLFAPIIILRDIGRATCVTTQTILGALCVYIQFGIVSSLLLIAFERLVAGSVLAPGQTWISSQYLFFSFTTLTTTGYGNLVPSGQWGQVIAMFEAVTGQIYLVIVVSRLVSIWGASGK